MKIIEGHEIIGQRLRDRAAETHRLVGQMPAETLVDLWLTVTSQIVKRGSGATAYRHL